MAALQVGDDAGMDQGGGRGNRQVWMDSGPSTDVDTGLFIGWCTPSFFFSPLILYLKEIEINLRLTIGNTCES